jgi:hypothetical protein
LTFTNSRRRNFLMGLHPHPDGSFRQISRVSAETSCSSRVA